MAADLYPNLFDHNNIKRDYSIHSTSYEEISVAGSYLSGIQKIPSGKDIRVGGLPSYTGKRVHFYDANKDLIRDSQNNALGGVIGESLGNVDVPVGCEYIQFVICLPNESVYFKNIYLGIYDDLVYSSTVEAGNAGGATINDTTASTITVFSSTKTNALLALKVNLTDVVNDLNQTTSGKVLDGRQGKVLNDLITGLNTSKVATADVVNDLTVTTSGKVLDARQGKALKDSIDTLASNTVPTSRTITINGTTLDLTANRSFTVAGGGSVSQEQLDAAIATALADPDNQTPFDSNDFIIDSGDGTVSINPAVLVGQVDATPTTSSTNPVQSGGVKSYVDGLVNPLSTLVDLKAPLASPALTGNPTAPTQTAGNNSTRIATTAYTDAAVAAVSGGAIADLSVTDAKLATDNKVGSLTTLITTSKASVVSSINEIARGANQTSDFLMFGNVLAETDPSFLATTSLSPTQGSLYRRYFIATKSGVILKIGFRVFTAGTNLVADAQQNGFAIYDASGNRLGLGDCTTLFTSTGNKTVTLDSSVTLVAGTKYAFTYMSQHSAGTAGVVSASLASGLVNFNTATAPFNYERLVSASGMTSTLATTGGIDMVGSSKFFAMGLIS